LFSRHGCYFWWANLRGGEVNVVTRQSQ
jgi:hypothetical protein